MTGLDLKSQYLKAVILEDMGKYKESEVEFQKILQSNQQSIIIANSALHLAKNRLRRGEYDKLNDTILKGLANAKVSSTKQLLELVHGDLLFAQSKYEQAIEVFSNISKDSLSQSEKSVMAFRLGVCYGKLEKYDNAVESYRDL